MTSPIPQPSADHPNTAGGVDASSVTVGYGQRTIIRDLSATFPAGKITTIVGPNGCGKSTLLRAMSGLLNLDTGTVSVDGQNISDMKRKDVARILGMLPQSPWPQKGYWSPIWWPAGGTHIRHGSASGPPRTKTRSSRP